MPTRPLTLLLRTCVSALIVLMLSFGGLLAQCPSPDVAIVNSCVTVANPTNPERTVEVELLVLQNGEMDFPVNNLGIDLPFNGFGSQNGDVGTGPDGTPYNCAFKVPTVTALTGCGDVVPLGPDGIIPANATVLFVMTGNASTVSIDSLDFSALCSNGRTIYVLQNACERTVGALANRPGSGANTLRTITVNCPSEATDLTYDTALLPDGDGAYYDRTADEYGLREDCSVPAPVIAVVDTMVVDTMTVDTMMTDTMTTDTSGMDTVTVDTVVMNDTLVMAPDFPLYLPTAFSPNRDGVNDRYRVGLPLGAVGTVRYTIYDRWGGRIYIGTEPWDGHEAPDGVYLAVVDYFEGGVLVKRVGREVLLIR
ncbi:gliding motility-associated C-terminal domain-containing protein [Lewinella sp. 4G2]|uniref:T9SS type B sorting domain-containing protein n=1 Tax=Lewinella sp. 4G2 TaxID=1803372 RepID=UPI0007B49061|nr:gliding motility-associated C-terminal domain-containing protein [Lewinella sp. 4G2]OAV43413.1 hypothetical protein A3850_002380 [Lewinella sp. 4G2]